MINMFSKSNTILVRHLMGYCTATRTCWISFENPLDAIQISVELWWYSVYFVYSNWSRVPTESYKPFYLSVGSNFPRNWLIIFFPTFSWSFFFFFSKGKSVKMAAKLSKFVQNPGFLEISLSGLSWLGSKKLLWMTQIFPKTGFLCLKIGWRQSLMPSVSSRNKSLIIAVKNYTKADIKVFRSYPVLQIYLLCSPNVLSKDSPHSLKRYSVVCQDALHLLC